MNWPLSLTLNAVQLEQQLCDGVAKKVCKDQILEQYLNTVYLGRGAYGVQAGAQTYFDKPASEINYAEATVLASLIRYPNGYDPIRFPKVAKERRLVVLKRMQDRGLIDQNQATSMKYGIRGIPTLMLFKDGNIVATHVGALTKSQLTAFIDSNV